MELGSEYNLELNELEVTENNLYKYLDEYNYELFDSGRSALKMIPVNKDKLVLLPEFVCESVINCFDIDKILFYKINSNFEIDLSDLLEKMSEEVSTILVTHYFGKVQQTEVLNKIRSVAEKMQILIIEDTTQSLFSKTHTIGDYMIASIRKWLPIPMGGVLYSKKGIELPNVMTLKRNSDNSRSYGMILKNLYLQNKLDCNKEYRTIFGICEEKLNYQKENKLISDFTRFLISCEDINILIEKRKKNYHYVAEALKNLGILPVQNLEESECPFALVLRMPERDRFRQYLINNNIYCAVHWPFAQIQEKNRIGAKYNAETLISLPIDQRYGPETMQYMVGKIKEYGGELSF